MAGARAVRHGEPSQDGATRRRALPFARAEARLERAPDRTSPWASRPFSSGSSSGTSTSHDLVATLSAAHPGWLGLALAITLFNFPLRSWRWTRLLHHVQRVSQLEAFSATCIGFAASVLLPARAGEIVRPAVLSRRTGIPFAPALASIAVERLIDLVAVVAPLRRLRRRRLGAGRPHSRGFRPARAAPPLGVPHRRGDSRRLRRPRPPRHEAGPRRPGPRPARASPPGPHRLARRRAPALVPRRAGVDPDRAATWRSWPFPPLVMWLLNALQFHAVTRAFDVVASVPGLLLRPDVGRPRPRDPDAGRRRRLPHRGRVRPDRLLRRRRRARRRDRPRRPTPSPSSRSRSRASRSSPAAA